jgi:hypothetical protein
LGFVFINVEMNEVVCNANAPYAKLHERLNDREPDGRLHGRSNGVRGDVHSKPSKVGAVWTPTNEIVLLWASDPTGDVQRSANGIANVLAQHGDPAMDPHVIAIFFKLMSEEVVCELLIS